MSLPEERVLSTLNRDGTRNVLYPKLSRGRFLHRRRLVGYALIALFVLLPRIRIGGRPALLIDLGARELSAFGAVFRPSQGFLLALLGMSIVLVVFLVTALYGRVWCGWGCPQTVYLEHVFRPIERWLGGKRATRAQKLVRLVVYAALAFALSNVFLAYFVGTDRLEQWVFESPRDHLGGFLLVVGVAGLMLFDFAYFREQVCIVACPYGRLQAALLDDQSLIVGYDAARGEPRAKAKKHLPIANAGDCVDCSACVTTCPTGIDIRDGLQMECIGCAQCIDACDAVMQKLGRAQGLIRYTSKDELAGKPRKLWRPRTIVYPALLLVTAGLFTLSLADKPAAEVWVDRVSGPSFVTLPDGAIAARVQLQIENETDAPRAYTFALADAPAGAALRSALPAWQAPPRTPTAIPLFVDVPRGAFVHGQLPIRIAIRDNAGFSTIVRATLLGPDGGSR